MLELNVLLQVSNGEDNQELVARLVAKAAAETVRG